MLELSGVSIAYQDGSTPVVSGADASWPNGLHLIVGPNGAGKTTLFAAILGLVQHTGTVTLDGRVCVAGDRRHAAAFDDAPTYGRITGAQQLRVADPTISLRRACDLGLVDSQLLGRRTSEYSYGQRKRLALTSAFASDARCVLLDEPTNGLDDSSRAVLRDAIEDARKDRVILVATHDSWHVGVPDSVRHLEGGRLLTIPTDREHDRGREATAGQNEMNEMTEVRDARNDAR